MRPGKRRDRRRHAVAEDAALDLHPRDELLDEHLLVVTARELDGRRELRLVVHLRDADGRAEARRLHEDGVAERVVDLVAEPDRDVPRDGDAAVPHHLLEEVLVHRECGGRDAGADVGHARELEQPLHRAVLAERPVEDRQARRRRRRARQERCRPSGSAASPRAFPGSWTPGVSRGALSELPAAVAPDRHGHRLVALRVERLEHRARRRERDVVLARPAAGEDRDADAPRHCPESAPVVGSSCRRRRVRRRLARRRRLVVRHDDRHGRARLRLAAAARILRDHEAVERRVARVLVLHLDLEARRLELASRRLLVRALDVRHAGRLRPLRHGERHRRSLRPALPPAGCWSMTMPAAAASD